MNLVRKRFELSAREIALIFLFWTSLAALSSVNRLLGMRDFGMGRVISSPAGPIALAFIEAWTWALFTLVIFWLSSSSHRVQSQVLRVGLLLLAGIAIAIAVYVLLDFARSLIITIPPGGRRRGGGPPVFAPLREIGRFRFLNQLLVYGAVLAAGFAREFFLRDRVRQQHESRLQAQLAEARLDALRMQINPHFLFNTLHAISALVERDPGGVRKMIARLSELLRHTIDSKASDEISLRDELAFLRRYIEIMEIRFQGRMQVAMNIAGDTLDALVPNLILQPLVENALEHGVSRTRGEGRIEIDSRREGDALVLSVRDNGPGVDANSASGVGLANTRARLAQLYEEDAALSLTAAESGGAIARVTLPYHTSADRFEGRADA
ncbi:MAG TPA: histidine kinase [Thermoanaerobaculia bacterium]|nr:histidine kinase [Thermoanaerobaculia bacterium]